MTLTEEDKQRLREYLEKVALRHKQHYEIRKVKLNSADLFAFIKNRDKFNLISIKDILKWNSPKKKSS